MSEEWQRFLTEVLKPKGLNDINGEHPDDKDWLEGFYLRRRAAQINGPEAEEALSEWIGSADESILDRRAPIIRVIVVNTEPPQVRETIERMTRRSRGRA